MVGPDSALSSGCTLMLDGVVLPRKDQVHNLGVLLDPALLLDSGCGQECILPDSSGMPAESFLGKEELVHSYTCSYDIKP